MSFGHNCSVCGEMTGGGRGGDGPDSLCRCERAGGQSDGRGGDDGSRGGDGPPVRAPQISGSAIAAVQAALFQDPRVRSPEEESYDEVLASCVLKPCGHVQKEKPADVETRLYSVTTIASSARYGGTRTPVVCDSFEAAREIVEGNHGDIWEHSYMLCVVEGHVPNRLYSRLGEQYWYMWVGGREGGYRPIEVPDRYRNSFGFGIG